MKRAALIVAVLGMCAWSFGQSNTKPATQNPPAGQTASTEFGVPRWWLRAQWERGAYAQPPALRHVLPHRPRTRSSPTGHLASSR